jgi:sulfur-carrier protein
MKVLLFARLRDLAGADAIEIALPAGATVGELRRALAAAHPKLANLLDHCAVAVANEFASDQTVIRPDQAVALLPPVSGG